MALGPAVKPYRREFAEEVEARHFVMPFYPHMSPQEKELWDRFLQTTDLTFYAIEYDLRIGPGYVPAWLKEPYLIRMAKAITQLRIDAVGYRRAEIWIFEVKPRAGRSALGQLEAYAYWFEMEKRPALPLRLACVSREVDANMIQLFRARAIQIFLV